MNPFGRRRMMFNTGSLSSCNLRANWSWNKATTTIRTNII